MARFSHRLGDTARRIEHIGSTAVPGLAAHRMFRTRARDVHVHLWGSESAEIDRYLAFRDQLRRSVDDRRAYERLKRDLATRESADMNEYAYAKGEMIEAILARAGTIPE